MKILRQVLFEFQSLLFCDIENEENRLCFSLYRRAEIMKLDDELLLKEPHEILLVINSQNSSLLAALNNEDISLDKFLLILKVLEKVITCTSSDAVLNQLLLKVLSSNVFMTRMSQAVSRDIMEMVVKGMWSSDVALACVEKLMRVLLACFIRIPITTNERAHLLVTSLDTLVTHFEAEFEVPSDFQSLYQVGSIEFLSQMYF